MSLYSYAFSMLETRALFSSSFLRPFIRSKVYILLTSGTWRSKGLDLERTAPGTLIEILHCHRAHNRCAVLLLKKDLTQILSGEEKKRIPRRSILNVYLTSSSSGALLPPATICIIFHVINLDKRDGFMWVAANWVRDTGLHARNVR